MKSSRYKNRHRRRSEPPEGAPIAPTPERLRAGTERGRILIELDGHIYEALLRQPGDSRGRRPRSDTIAAQLGGQWRVLSLRSAAVALIAEVPRTATLEQLAERF